MLTPSSNQYLRPEYLSPLPTTLDAKKSPLALLAQTCSNIGADTPNAKSLIPPVEKREISNSNRDSASEKSSSRDKTPQSDDKSSFKPYESIKKEDNNGSDNNSNEKSGFRTPTSKSSSPAVSSSGSVNSDKASPCASIESTAKTGSNGGSGGNGNEGTAVTSSITNPLNSVAAAMQSQHNRISIGCGNMFVEVNHHESGLPKDGGLGHHHHHHLPLSGYKPGQLIPGLPPLSSLSNCTGCTQIVGHVPVDTSSTNPSSYPSGIATHNGNPMKSGYPGLSPYVAYARVKTATGGTTLVPICRDPYCTNCQLSMQSAQQLVGAIGGGGGGGGVGSCPSGCTQCNHEKGLAAGLGGPLSALSMVPGMPGVSSAANIVPLGSGLYTQAMLTPRPYVCNWIAGDTYCGKRFTNSEELLQHLRTHTNLSAAESAAAASLPLLNPSLSLPSAASLGAGCHLHYSMAPSLTSPAGLHRTYPTSLSPLSSASRYHPYKPSLAGLPGVPLSPFPPHPGLSAAAQYFSPYAMYGQRLGAAVHP